jgi:chromosome segregation ATPase
MLSRDDELASMKKHTSTTEAYLKKMQMDLDLAGKAMAAKDVQVEQLQANVSTLDAEVMRLRKLNNQLECDLHQAQEVGRTLDSESGQHKSQFELLQDKIKNVTSELQGEKARRLSAEERERETRHAFTISQEALRTLEGKFEMTWQEHEMISSQTAKLRQEYAVASAQLKGQTEEIEEAQRLLRDATQMVEMEQSRRIAADDREKLATQNLMTAEMEKRELENKIWLSEERQRQSEAGLEQVRESFKAQEDDKKSLMKKLQEKSRELEEVKEKSKELASKFQLIGSLKKEFELAERHRSSAEERVSAQEKELEEARDMARKAHETSRELAAKSKEDDAEIERLNHEIVALQEKRIASQQERMSHDRSQENTTKQLRERLREAEEKLQMAEMRYRKSEMQKGEIEAELVDANRRIQSLEHHADALLRQGSIHTSVSDASESLCGVGGTFQKSGGGFVVTGLDSAPEHMSSTAGSDRALRMGDLAIAIDDIPLADMSSIQFRNAIQGPMGTSVSLLIGIPKFMH